jgi:hypothetical protein
VVLVCCVFLQWSDLSYKGTKGGEIAGGRGNKEMGGESNRQRPAEAKQPSYSKSTSKMFQLLRPFHSLVAKNRVGTRLNSTNYGASVVTWRGRRWRSVMTHKYRGCIVVLSINKSVEPNEEQKVLMSSFDQGITVNTSKQVFRGIW